MNDRQKATAVACLAGSHDNTMDFPQVVDALTKAGFESYSVDFRRRVATYYLPDGGSIELASREVPAPIAPRFDTAGMVAAIREAQQQVPGYTYGGFCGKAAAAGCVGYVVSFSGRRALYIGRTAETHVEHFPG